MKDNSKNRKLIFIRHKNAINAGLRHGYASGKITNEIANDAKALLNCIESIARNGFKSLKKRWKLKWEYDHYEWQIGINDDDFLKDVKTIQVKFLRWQ